MQLLLQSKSFSYCELSIFLIFDGKYRLKNGNKRKNKPQYIERFGVFWMRTINPPKEELKQIQKSINKYLVDNISMPLYAYGGVKGRDNILNARVHKGKNDC